MKKLRTQRADIRYLFYSCPGDSREIVSLADSDVTIVSLGSLTSRLVGDLAGLGAKKTGARRLG
jgi:hypothetical protein